ncbi:MAG: YraN family protein [Cytophagales bacterium]|nr:MAG: YraN family protein [Cytophagales bacterium]
MSSNTQKGNWGEKLAEDFLVKNDFHILQKNYRSGRFEIDIIAQKDEILIFVEVKYRKSLKFGFPEQAVSKTKMNQLKIAAENYIFETDWNKNIRFDIISIVDIKEKTLEIVHILDAF